MEWVLNLEAGALIRAAAGKFAEVLFGGVISAFIVAPFISYLINRREREKAKLREELLANANEILLEYTKRMTNFLKEFGIFILYATSAIAASRLYVLRLIRTLKPDEKGKMVGLNNYNKKFQEPNISRLRSSGVVLAAVLDATIRKYELTLQVSQPAALHHILAIIDWLHADTSFLKIFLDLDLGAIDNSIIEVSALKNENSFDSTTKIENINDLVEMLVSMGPMMHRVELNEEILKTFATNSEKLNVFDLYLKDNVEVSNLMADLMDMSAEYYEDLATYHGLLAKYTGT